jgi:hypothetical protein
MKKNLLVVASGVLIYLLLRRSFGNPHRHIKLKKNPDTEKILSYKFAGSK